MRALWEIGCNGSLFMRARSEGHGAGAIQAAATAARQVEASIIRRSFLFEEKRILRRKRTGTPDHTRDSHSATKRERDVDTAKLKAGGVLTGGRLGPLQGGPRAKAKCGAGRAKRGGAGCS